MKKSKKHSAKQLTELTQTAVKNARQRRATVLNEVELDQATGGAVGGHQTMGMFLERTSDDLI